MSTADNSKDSRSPLHGDSDAAVERVKQAEQSRLCTELEHALRSRARLTVQAMPHGCEIIDVESGDLITTIHLGEVPAKNNEAGFDFPQGAERGCDVSGKEAGPHPTSDSQPGMTATCISPIATGKVTA